ncbi:antibiotic biosynthesis monooxygenase [Paenibacillus taiwanensis]|uniref:antibiotic biosynthesis monooxygenase n=1 Tax=Paenibacillus taiwanensis TaxID=401638 RepID=UPI0004062C3F|nr:antibiotic biosynthesis monooxygenase [Paenibacillus taiwanensis]
MIAVTNRLRTRKGEGNHLKQRFAQPKRVHHMPGFVSLELMTSTQSEEYDEYVVRTVWQDRESFEGWVNSQQFKEGHARREKADDSIIEFKVTIYDIVHHHLPAGPEESVAAATGE